MTPMKSLEPRRWRGKISIATLATTAALFGGGSALAPSHAAAMTDDNLGCVEELDVWYFLFELDTDCSDESAGGSGSSSSSGGNDPWDGGWQVDQGSGGSDLWEGWNLDQDSRGESPEAKWARKEREAVKRFEDTVNRAKERLLEDRQGLVLEQMDWIEKQHARAERDRKRVEHADSERPRGGKARKGRNGRR
jgi:hypothetical protein